MASPRFTIRSGRDISRETLLLEDIAAALKTLQAQDGLRYEETLDLLDQLGLPTVFSDTSPVQFVSSDLRYLEYALSFVHSRVRGAGYTHSGRLITDGEYQASRGEVVLVAGAAKIILPPANKLLDDGYQVHVKLMSGTGPVEVETADGSQIDGSNTFSPIVVPGTNVVFQRVTGGASVARRGGAAIDLSAVGAADEVTLNGTTYVEGTDFTTAAELADAINGNETELVAVAVGDIVTVQCVTPGRTNDQLLTEFGALTVTNAGGTITLTRVGGDPLDPIDQLNVEGSDLVEHDRFLRGGARLDVANSQVGDTVTMGSEVFTHVAGVPGAGEYTNIDELVALVNAAFADLEAEARGNLLVVQARVVGQSDAALNTIVGGAIATTIAGAFWLRVDGTELDPADQLNVAGSERGGFYVVV